MRAEINEQRESGNPFFPVKRKRIFSRRPSIYSIENACGYICAQHLYEIHLNISKNAGDKQRHLKKGFIFFSSNVIIYAKAHFPQIYKASALLMLETVHYHRDRSFSHIIYILKVMHLCVWSDDDDKFFFPLMHSTMPQTSSIAILFFLYSCVCVCVWK